MKPFTKLRTTAAPLKDKGKLMVNVDTDMIIPKQFLKTTEREGLSEGLFYDLKTNSDGSPDPDFVFNKAQYQGAGVLIAGENFGCGSSREHAPWALLDQGITCVIAPSFADIFYNNCIKNGILPARVSPADQADLMQAAKTGKALRIDLEQAQIALADVSMTWPFEIDAEARTKLLTGADDISLALADADLIDAFEAQHHQRAPWLKLARAQVYEALNLSSKPAGAP